MAVHTPAPFKIIPAKHPNSYDTLSPQKQQKVMDAQFRGIFCQTVAVGTVACAMVRCTVAFAKLR